MRITVDISVEQLREAMQHTGASVRGEAIVTALAEFNRHRRLAKLVDRFGSYENFLSHDDLRRLRSDF